MRLSDYDQRQLDADYSAHMDATQRDRERAAVVALLGVCSTFAPALKSQAAFQRMFGSMAGIDSRTKAEALAAALLFGPRENKWPDSD